MPTPLNPSSRRGARVSVQRSVHRRAARGRLLVIGILACSLVATACTSSTDTTTGPAGTGTGTAGSGGVVQRYKVLDAGGPLSVAALQKGSVDVAELFSVNGAIAANGWVVLTDDKHLQAADNFVPAIRTDKASPEVSAVLDEVSAALTQADVQQMVQQVSVDGQNPDDVAKAWLGAHPLSGTHPVTGSLTVGSAGFTESEVVAELYAAALAGAGADVKVHPNIGERAAYIPLLTRGDIDVVPEFTASLLVYLDAKATPSADLDTTYTAAKKAAAAKGVTLLTPSAVSSVNVFVVTAATAKKYNLTSLSDVAAADVPLRWGVAPACATNAQCIPGLEKTYGLRFAEG